MLRLPDCCQRTYSEKRLSVKGQVAAQFASFPMPKATGPLSRMAGEGDGVRAKASFRDTGRSPPPASASSHRQGLLRPSTAARLRRARAQDACGRGIPSEVEGRRRQASSALRGRIRTQAESLRLPKLPQDAPRTPRRAHRIPGSLEDGLLLLPWPILSCQLSAVSYQLGADS